MVNAADSPALTGPSVKTYSGSEGDSVLSAAAEPKLLILETSGKFGQISLARGATILGSRRLEEARRHARDLAPAVAGLLVEAAWKPQDLHAVVVSRGPGSYTGLRVGIMSAKTLAFATGCALIAPDTFEAIAQQAPAEAVSLDVLADAQQDNVYVQRFARAETGSAWAAISPLRIQRISDWLAQSPAPDWITGPGVRVLGERRPAGTRTTPADSWDPQPQSLLHIGLARFMAGERDDLWTLEPLYLRPSAAEEKWQQHQPHL